MSKRIQSLLLAGCLLLGVGSSTTVRAATTDTTTGSLTGTTTAKAAFSAPTTPATPVDPTDPNKPAKTVPDPNNGATNPSGATGLALIWAPKSLDFGSHPIDFLNAQTYTAAGNVVGDGQTAVAKGNLTSEMQKADATTSNVTGAQVSDERGSNAGWKLTVTGAPLTMTTDAKAVITAKGVALTLPKGTLANSGDNGANGAVATEGVVNMDGSSTGVTILSAAKGSGAGTTVDKMDPNQVTLKVPANAVQTGTYSGNLTWTLTNAE